MYHYNSSTVASAHDRMANEYDDLFDLWYPWLFAQVHSFITERLPHANYGSPILDIGCGTGFQSFLLSRAGFAVDGIDISERLIEVARSKAPVFVDPDLTPTIFNSNESWAHLHNLDILRHLDRIRGDRPIMPPHFEVDDILTRDLGESRYEIIVCCGSVLNFINDYPSVIHKISKALKPGGKFFLEIEQKVNLDLVWPAIDIALSGALGYNQSLIDVLHNLFLSYSRSVKINYPFELHNGETLSLPIWLFSVSDLECIFESANLMVLDRLGIHQVTNLLPSTLLHRKSPQFIDYLFNILRPLDGLTARYWPFWRLGCSIIYCLTRQ